MNPSSRVRTLLLDDDDDDDDDGVIFVNVKPKE
jgi:hypothetical protein